MARKVIGQGIRLYRQSQYLGMLYSIEAISKNRDTVPVKIDRYGYRRFLGTLRSSGVLQVEAYFSRELYDILEDDFNDNRPREYTLFFPDDANTTWRFQGLVTSLNNEIEVGAALTIQFEIAISGRIEVFGQSSS